MFENSSEEEDYFDTSGCDFSVSSHAEFKYDRTPPRTKRLARTKGKKEKFNGSKKCTPNSEEEVKKLEYIPFDLRKEFFDGEKNIIYLTDSNFEEVFKSTGLFLVMFYQKCM